MDFTRFEGLVPIVLIIIGTLLAVAGVGSAVNYLGQSSPELEPVKLVLIVFSVIMGAAMLVYGSDLFVNE